MAENEKEKPQAAAKDGKAEAPKGKPSGGKMLYIIAGVVALVGTAGGFGLAQILAGGSSPADATHESGAVEKPAETAKKPAGGHGGSSKPAGGHGESSKPAGGHGGSSKSAGGSGVTTPEPGKLWYFPLEAVIVNLDEPGVSRYLRASITLELSPDWNAEEGMVFLEEKALILRDTLRTYFADLSLEEVRGRRNLDRIKRQIQDMFNEILFPDGKPYVHGIFLKEFAVQ